MTIPSSQPRKSTSSPPLVSTGSRDVSPKRGGGTQREGHGCSTFCIFLVALLLVSFGGAAIWVYRHYSLGLNMHSYHDGDQIRVSSTGSDLNSYLCQTYTVNSGERADVFLTNGPATISSGLTEVITVSDSGLMPDDHFDFRAFFLLPGSTIAVKACLEQHFRPRQHAKVLVVKGDANFRDWLSDPFCFSCLEDRIPIPPLGLCALASYTVQEKDTYYVIVTRARRWDVEQALRARVDMRVTKTIYDFTHPKQMCHMTHTCQLNLTYGTHDDVIVQLPGQESMPVTASYFTTECQLRGAFWTLVFGVLPAGLVLLLTTCCLLSARARYQRGAILRQKKRAAGSVFTVRVGENTPGSRDV